MEYKAYLNEDKIYLYYKNGHVGRRTGAIYDLGYHLTDFSSWTSEQVREGFRKLIRIKLNIFFTKNEEIKRFWENIYDVIDLLDMATPYFHFYSQALFNFMTNYDSSGGNINIAEVNFIKEIPNARHMFELSKSTTEKHFYTDYYSDYEAIIEENKKLGKFEIAEFLHVRLFYFNLALECIFDDFAQKQEMIKSQLDYITNINNDKDMEKLTPLQRLYILDYFNDKEVFQPVYTNVFNHTEFLPNKPVKHDIKTKTELAKLLIGNDISIVEMYDIKSIDDLIRFEIILITKNELPIRRCKNCNLYFIPRGRVDSEYCHRISPNETKPCNQIGAMKIYNNKFENDPIYKAYNKAYKRLYARTQKNIMSKEDFFEWTELSQKWKNDCYDGVITFSEFLDLLGNK